MASPKTLARLEAQIQRRVAHCLQFELADPRAGFITVTRVELAKDVSTARIYFSVLGDDGEERLITKMLEDATGFVQRQVARVLKTRTMPRLSWHFDETVREAARLDVLIQGARDRDRELAGEEPDASSDGTEGDAEE